MRTAAAILVATLVVAGTVVVAVPGAAVDNSDSGGIDQAPTQSDAAQGSVTSAIREDTGEANESQQDGEYIQECAATPPEDFAHPDGGNDVVGFVDGRWYNESLSLNTSDGLNQTELTALKKRTAARYEAMRCWTMPEGVPPIEVRTREEHRNETGDVAGNIDTSQKLSINAQYETLLMIGSDEDYWELRQENRGSFAGFYLPSENKIIVVTDDTDELLIDESTLAHELGHAIQHQQFDLGTYYRYTTDGYYGRNIVVEGDATLIGSRYAEACADGFWGEPCVTERTTVERKLDNYNEDSDAIASWGLYLSTLQPYSDGPTFLEYLLTERYDGDWSELDELYDRRNTPQTAYVSAFPETFGDFERVSVQVPDRSTDDWRRIGGPGYYDTFGVAGISAMFMRPTYEEETSVWDPSVFIDSDDVDDSGPWSELEYAHPETEGWRGDRIYTYTNDDDETGAVWKLAYASEESRDAFLDSYRELITVSGGERVEGYENTYTFGADSKFDMALSIVVEDNRIAIIKAPSVEELRAVHDVDGLGAPDSTPTPAETPTETPEPTPTKTPEPTPNPTDTSDEDTPTVETDTPDPSDDDGAGFGVISGGIAVLVVLVVALRRRL